jgi:hypothetical protein
VGSFGAGTDRVEANIWVLDAVCIDLERRFLDWIAPFSWLFGVLFMAFRASDERASYRQMWVHLAVLRNGM